jgi:hypothetical protein
VIVDNTTNIYIYVKQQITTLFSDRNPGHGFGQAQKYGYHIGGVMVKWLASITVHRGIETQSDQTKDNKIGMCCYSAEQQF